MGRRKFKLGSIRKKEERKRQTNKVNKVGRPPRIRKNEEREKQINKVGRTPENSRQPPHQVVCEVL